MTDCKMSVIQVFDVYIEAAIAVMVAIVDNDLYIVDMDYMNYVADMTDKVVDIQIVANMVHQMYIWVSVNVVSIDSEYIQHLVDICIVFVYVDQVADADMFYIDMGIDLFVL